MTLSPDLHFAAIITGYLDTAASRAAGVPDIPVHRMDDGAEVATPRLSVRCDEVGSSARLRIFNVMVVYDFLDAPDSPATVNAASTGLRAIDQRLRDETALFAHIAALSASDRAGWELYHHWYPNPEDCRREDTAVTKLNTVIQLQVFMG